jgi:hypothetical protein
VKNVILVAGYWLLVAGYWLLVAGFVRSVCDHASSLQ